MKNCMCFAIVLFALLCSVAVAKDKKKIVLPEDILKARTVLVAVDPDAGIDANDPNANSKARDTVERALMDWGRFTPLMDAETADLIIIVRKGNCDAARPTIGGVPANGRPVVLQPTDSGVRVGGRRGNPNDAGDPTNTQASDPHSRVEIGAGDDTFAVYRGTNNPNSDPLASPPVWRFVGKDALKSPKVPAVQAFREVIAEAEKQRDSKP